MPDWEGGYTFTKPKLVQLNIFFVVVLQILFIV